MSTVTSRDGTTIAYDIVGQGPPLILVDGALCSRRLGPMPELARRLAGHFRVVVYDRRGRGESGNTPPWAPDREIDDLDALVAAVGGSAALFGLSSGAVLALDAAARGVRCPRVAVYEPPLIVDATRPPVTAEFIQGLRTLLDRGNRGEVVRRFMRLVGMPGIAVALMRLSPSWRRLLAVAHTIPYDLTLLQGLQSGRTLPASRWAGVRAPVLVLDGGKSDPWMRNGARALANLLPNATARTLPGQTHMVKSEVLAPALIEFLASASPAELVARTA